MSRTIHIALRFDDPSPTSDHALEREIFAILGELGIIATVAVVPFGIGTDGLVPLTRDNVPHLVAAHAEGVIDVAQHGYAHKHMTSTPKGAPSEFWGVPTDEQQRCVDAGHDQLTQTFGQPIRGFIPPGILMTTRQRTILRPGVMLSFTPTNPDPVHLVGVCDNRISTAHNQRAYGFRNGAF